MRSRALVTLTLAAAGFTLSMFYRVSATVIAPALSVDLNLSVAQLGDLSAAFFYAFAVCQIPLGVALDRLGPRLVMGGCAVAGIAGAVTFALAGGYHGALAGRILMGLGMSMNLMGSLALVAAWFPANRFAQLSGLLVGVGTLGQVLAATPLAWLAEALGWRGAFLLVVAINVVQAVLFVILVRDRPAGVPKPSPVGKNPFSGLGRVFRLKAYWFIGTATFFRYGSAMALQGLWAGPFIIYGLKQDPVTAGNALLCLSLGYAVALPISGRLSDQVLGTRKWPILGALAASGLLFLALGALPGGVDQWWIYAAFLAIGMISAPGQIMYAHIKELVPDSMAGTAMTGVNLYTMLGPAVLMQAAGWLVPAEPSQLADPTEFWPVWLLLAGGLLFSAFLYFFLPDSRPARSRN